MKPIPAILLAAAVGWPAAAAAQSDDMAADFARVQERVTTAQSELMARRAQLALLEARAGEARDGSRAPFSSDAGCADFREKLRGSAATAPIKQAEARIDAVVARLVRANDLRIAALCRSVVSPSDDFGAFAPDQTPVVEPDETGQAQVELEGQSLKAVFVTAGAVRRLSDEELAAVVAHELSHLVLYYTRDIEQDTLAAKRAAQDSKSSPYAKPDGRYLENWVFGQRQQGELDADRLGAVFLRRAGYDPRAMARLLAHLVQFEQPAPDHPSARVRSEIFARELLKIEAGR